MSIIDINFDTKTKELTLKIDGKKVKDVGGVTIQAYEEDGKTLGWIEIVTSIYQKDEKTGQVTKIYATQRTECPVDEMIHPTQTLSPDLIVEASIANLASFLDTKLG